MAGQVTQLGPLVSEWTSNPPVTVFQTSPVTSLGLPVEDPPEVAWFDPATQWANVQDYGAVGDGVTDDSVALQAAFNSGKPVIVLPKANYLNTVQLTIPATVQRLEALGADGTGFATGMAAGDGGLLIDSIAHVNPPLLVVMGT